MQVKLQNLWYGNELSEYDTVQSTVLVDGRRYLTVVRRLIAVPIGDIREWQLRHRRHLRELRKLLNPALIRAHRLLQMQTACVCVCRTK